MRVLAASFDDEAAAEVVRDGLARRFALRGDELAVAPLGRASYPDGPAALLAGRFRDGDAAAAAAVMEGHGGTMVTDIDSGRIEG
jgi:hypothetical protein